MSFTFRDKYAQTVQGIVSGDNLGVTLTHEHLFMQFDVAFTKAPKNIQYPNNGTDAFRLPNLGTLRQYPYGLLYNLKLDDTDTHAVMSDELMRFKSLGGSTIVENTTEGIYGHGGIKNVKTMKKLSEQTGVNIIIGTGYYVGGSQTQSTLGLSIEKMHTLMLKELTQGIEEDPDIKCGVIGEIGCSYPIYDFEKNAIQAVAATQEATNAPVTFHPGRDSNSPFEIIRIFTEAGGKAQDVVMSHLDRTIFDEDQLLEFAKFNTFLQYDLFGTECSYYQLQEEIDMVSDAQRIQKLKFLSDSGHLHQLLMSHDIHTKHRLCNFGGHGYGHILQNIVPKMRIRGFSQDEIDTVTIANPKRWLTG